MAHIDPTPDAQLDAQLELKKRARRRLVGATALALLAAIVLPMVMDHAPKQPVQDIQIRIPSQDRQEGGFASRILPAKPATTPLPPLPPAAPATEARAEPPRPEAAATPAPAPKPESPKSAAPSAPKPDKGEKPEPAAKPVATANEEMRAKTVLGGDSAASAGGEQWTVQLGAYREAANVKQLLAKIKEMGLPTYTEPFNSPQGPRTRVRAGPFPSRDAAEKAQARIKTIGVNGPVAPK